MPQSQQPLSLETTSSVWPQQSEVTGAAQSLTVTTALSQHTLLALQADRLPNSPRRPRPAQAGLKVSMVVSVQTVAQRNQYLKPLVMSPSPQFRA